MAPSAPRRIGIRVVLAGLLVVVFSAIGWTLFVLIYGLLTGTTVRESAPHYGAIFGVAAGAIGSIGMGYWAARRTPRPLLVGLMVGLAYAILQAGVSILLGAAPLVGILARSAAGLIGGLVGGGIASRPNKSLERTRAG
jgi:hypothetical protein